MQIEQGTQEAQLDGTVLSPEARQILANFSVPVLEAEIRTRNGGEAPDRKEFLTAVQEFLDPETPIDPVSQIAIVSDLWIRLGREVPILNSEQTSQLSHTLEANPDKRVVPVPLMTLVERAETASAAGSLPHNETELPTFKLELPGSQHNPYGSLLRDSTKPAREGHAKFGLRYKTPSGVRMERDEYTEELLTTGQALEGPDGAIWTFPVMEVDHEIQAEEENATLRRRSKSKEVAPEAKSFYAALGSVSTPESLLVVELLHQVAGEPGHGLRTRFANEFVYKINRNRDARSDFKKLRYMGSITWDPSKGLMNRAVFPANRWHHSGVRETISGIGEPDQLAE